MSKSQQDHSKHFSRREFLRQAGLTCVVGSAGGVAVPSLAFGQEDSGPIDCGPPPQAKKHSRTGGESFASVQMDLRR